MNDKENNYNVNNELDNIELNKMFSLTYNFDILKDIITSLIKNQKKINYKLIELKLEKIYHTKRVDQLECDIIDLQLSGTIFEKAKKELSNRKDILQSKDYQNKIDKYIKEKDTCLNSINNPNQENMLLNEIIKNKNDKIEEEDIEEEIKASEKNVKKKELDEINIKMEKTNEEINNKLNDKMETIETKFKSYDKLLTSIDTNIKLLEEKANNKLQTEIPKIIDTNISSKLIKIENQIDKIDKKIENDLKQLEVSILKNTEDKIYNLRLELQNKYQEIHKKMKEAFKDIGNINHNINKYTPLNEYKAFLIDLDDRINKESQNINNEIYKIKKNIEKVKNDINEIVNDNTLHNNVIMLSKKYETLSNIVFQFRELQVEFEQDKKKLAEIEPNKYANVDIFNEYKDYTNKILDSFKKNFTDIKYILDDLKSIAFNGQASLKDLRSLEDNIKKKFDELKERIKEKYADKNYVNKNNKYIQFEINQKIEDYKKNEQNASWILAKKPIGLLCASCETYLGDLKEIENDKKYIPWNKYPPKDPIETIYHAGSGFSKILKKIGNEKKFRNNKSVVDHNSKLKNRNSIDDTNIKHSLKSSLKNNIMNQDNISYEKINNNNEIPKLPFGDIIKNKTTSNMMNIDDSLNKSDINNINNNKIFKLKSNPNLIKNKSFYAPKTERDEIIVFPPSLNNYRERSYVSPKIIKVYKKSINDNKSKYN